MRDFMTALLVVLLQLTCPRTQRAKDVLFQSSCNLCRESHKTQVWLCFLLLSFLSTSTCATHTSAQIKDLQECVNQVRQTIEKSDVMLYALSIDDIKDNCRVMTLRCYMLELSMVMWEEDVTTNKAGFINLFITELNPEDGCPQCETYPLTNITIFLDRIKNLLELMTSTS
ncbi:interleukin-15 isoform X2 [Parambassis ranga]|uniref:Interleukin n=1 Tax=Parambassis ranga TaxID=210632 RepID=A0A6P7JAC1_9TELE|nr:interleukin-15-like isoform X2 [Parambassis ranga]